MGETACNKFAWSAANTFTVTTWLTTATAANLPKYRTAAYNAYGLFDVNNFGLDSTSSNAMVSMSNMVLYDLGTSCTSTGKRIYVPMQFAA
jgi:hypothetical protein